MRESEVLSRKQKWMNLIGQQERRGKAVSVFCREYGVSEPSFYGWRKRLKMGRPVRFALVDAGMAAVNGSASIELVLASGNRLRIAPGADAATLRTVLRVLQEPA